MKLNVKTLLWSHDLPEFRLDVISTELWRTHGINWVLMCDTFRHNSCVPIACNLISLPFAFYFNGENDRREFENQLSSRGAGMAQWWELSPPTNVSRVRLRHMWVEFVVDSPLCPEWFFSWYSAFPPSSKTNISKFQFDPCELLGAPWVNKLHLILIALLAVATGLQRMVEYLIYVYQPIYFY